METQKTKVLLSCMIVDDEPLAVSLLKKYILRTDFLELKYICRSALQASQILAYDTVNIIFLDIKMPELTGLEFSKMVDQDTKIIFTTAYDQYAIEGYKVNALYYLLKPFDYDEFLESANKAVEWFEQQLSQTLKTNVKEFIFVRSEYMQIKILLNDVLYFEGLKDYIKIWLIKQPKPILTILSLKTLESMLNPANFMRVHRSFIVSLDKISRIEKGQIVINSTHITIARPYKKKFQAFIQVQTKN